MEKEKQLLKEYGAPVDFWEAAVTGGQEADPETKKKIKEIEKAFETL